MVVVDKKESPLSIPDEKMISVYQWIECHDYSRPRKDITRDFSDGVLCAEIVSKYLPKLVDLHNYTPAHSTKQKLDNWATLNRKVLSKIKFQVPMQTITNIIESKPGAIEYLLWDLKKAVEKQASKNPTIGGITVSSPILKPKTVGGLSGEKNSSSTSGKKEPFKKQENVTQSRATVKPSVGKSDESGDQCKGQSKDEVCKAQQESIKAKCETIEAEAQPKGASKSTDVNKISSNEVKPQQGAIKTLDNSQKVKPEPTATSNEYVNRDPTTTSLTEATGFKITQNTSPNKALFSNTSAKIQPQSTTKSAAQVPQKMLTVSPTGQTKIQENLDFNQRKNPITTTPLVAQYDLSRYSLSASVCDSEGILQVQPPSNVSSLANFVLSNEMESAAGVGNLDQIGAKDGDDVAFNREEILRQFEEKNGLVKFLEGEIKTLNYAKRGYQTMLAAKDRRIADMTLLLNNTQW